MSRPSSNYRPQQSQSIGGSQGAAASSVLDRPLRIDDNAAPKVSFSAFAFLFSEMCSRANLVPTKVKTVLETEERLATIGVQAGIRSVQLAALRDPIGFKQRPLTMEAVLRLIAEKLWVRWFGKQADFQKDTGTPRFFITDDDPLIIRHIHPTPDYVDSANHNTWFMSYASFVAGMIRGVLQSCQFPAQVATYHQPEEATPRCTWYVVEFEEHVWDRARRLKQA